MSVIEVQKIKVTVSIEAHKLPEDILPEPGAPGSAKAQVTLTVRCGEHLLTANVKAKSYRDVLTKAKESPHGAWAVLQGNLGAGGVLEGAGFTVQPIVPKETTPKPEITSATEASG